MKKLLLVVACFASTIALAQNNMLDTSIWAEGTGNFSGWSAYGGATKSERISGEDGWGNTSVLWVSLPSSASVGDGGYYSPYVNIDPTKTYRVTTWLKKTGTADGTSYFGLHSRSGTTQSTQYFGGNVTSNPYFWSGDLPEFDKWYLLVGYIHPNSYTGGYQGAMYEGDTGEVVANFIDYKFSPDATQLRNRALLFRSETPTDRQYHWAPTIYEVNGLEPTIEELRNAGGNTGGDSGLWAANGDDIHNINTGNVGVGTDTPARTLTVEGADTTESTLLVRNTSYSSTDAAGTASLQFAFANHFGPVLEATKFSTNISGLNFYGEYGFNVPQLAMTIRPTANGPRVGIGTDSPDEALTVKGTIHTQEVIVDLQGAVAPDYVFYKDYDLRTLQEVQEHIDTHGHLPNIPSAKQMEADGVKLKEMNLKLLEKIEELTLYILEQNRLNMQQQEALQEMRKELEALKSEK